MRWRAVVFALWHAHHDEGGVGNDGEGKNVRRQAGALATEMRMAQSQQILERIASVLVAVLADFVEFLRCEVVDGHHGWLRMHGAESLVRLLIVLCLCDNDAAEHRCDDDEKHCQSPQRAKKLHAVERVLVSDQGHESIVVSMADACKSLGDATAEISETAATL